MKNFFTAAKAALAVAFVLVSGSALSNDAFPKNKILRPITMNDGDFEVSVAAGHSTKVNGEDKTYIIPSLRYGITDNLSIGDGGLSYRFYAENDLQLGMNVGFRGSFDSSTFGDSVGVGASLFGKQIINDNLAFTFGLGYVHWDEEKLDNRSEVDYNLGVMFNVAPDWTLRGGYTYRDLEDFSQSHANVYNLSLSYALNDAIDVGIYGADSDFKEVINGHYLHNSFEETAGVFMNWRW